MIDLIEIRKYSPEDHNFIISSWIESYRNSRHAINVHPQTYYEKQESLSKLLINTCQVLVAVSKNDSTQIFGWICYSGNKVHYLYVKSPFRKNGIARGLFLSTGINGDFEYTHTPYIYFKTRDGTKLGSFRMEKISDKGRYNPYYLMM